MRKSIPSVLIGIWIGLANTAIGGCNQTNDELESISDAGHTAKKISAELQPRLHFNPASLPKTQYFCSKQGKVFDRTQNDCINPSVKQCEDNKLKFDADRKICVDKEICRFLGMDYSKKTEACIVPTSEKCKKRHLEYDSGLKKCVDIEYPSPAKCAEFDQDYFVDNETCIKSPKDCRDDSKCEQKQEMRAEQQRLLDKFYNLGDAPHVVRIEMDPLDAETFVKEKPNGGHCNWETHITRKFDRYTATVLVEPNFDEEILTFEKSEVRKKSWCWSFDTTKPSMKIALSKKDKSGRKMAKAVLGTDALVLNNSKQDLSLLRQCISYEIMHNNDVPAPRCNFAKVFLNDSELGLYVNVEAIKKPLLRKWFNDASGEVIEVEGEDIGNFYIEEMMQRKGMSSEGLSPKIIDAFIDIESYIKFWALETFLLHWDSYSNNLNNAYTYISPSDNKLRLIAWGIDQALQGDKLDDSRNYATSSIAKTLWENAESRKEFCNELLKVSTSFEKDKVKQRIDQMGKIVFGNIPSSFQTDPVVGQEEVNCWKKKMSFCLKRSHYAQQMEVLENVIDGLVDHVRTDYLETHCGMSGEDNRAENTAIVRIKGKPKPFRYGIGTRVDETINGWKLSFKGLGNGNHYAAKSADIMDSAMFVFHTMFPTWETADRIAFDVTIPDDQLDIANHSCEKNKGYAVSMAVQFGGTSNSWIESRETCLAPGTTHIELALRTNSWKREKYHWQFGTQLAPLGYVYKFIIKIVDNSRNKQKVDGHLFIDNFKLAYREKFDYFTSPWRYWLNDKGGCIDAAEQMLINNSLVPVTFADDNECEIATGKWTCFYTGETLNNYEDVAVDHIVSLSHADISGAHSWNTTQMRKFANNPENLVITSKRMDDQKGEKGPWEWKPDIGINWEKYIQKWREVKLRNGLNLGRFESDRLEVIRNRNHSELLTMSN